MFRVYGSLWASETIYSFEIGLLYSLLRQWNGFEDFNIMNFRIFC